MITSGIYNYVNILDKAADAANLRNELLTNNIANVSTPNYKRKDLDFESVLQGELAGEKNLSKAVKKANQNLETLDSPVHSEQCWITAGKGFHPAVSLFQENRYQRPLLSA